MNLGYEKLLCISATPDHTSKKSALITRQMTTLCPFICYDKQHSEV